MKDPPPTLHRLPPHERPAYRVVEAGAGACSLVELLAAVVGGPRQIEIACALVEQFRSAASLGRASVHELQRVPGVGLARTARIEAALELGRRALLPGEERLRVRSPVDAVRLLVPRMQALEQEELWVVNLDARGGVLGVEMVYRGNVDEAKVRPGEVFRSAIRAGTAVAVIVAHNHPSRDCVPSPQDVAMTERLVQCGELFGVEVLDHLVLGADGFTSMKREGLGFQEEAGEERPAG